ncbi:hypothetical protein [Sinorhizobium fredii]|uniref:hypothetical protein n=1 Tax=Rhizobium fredii TaxID=380 RepID=UPI0011D2A06B|nr:hypothetical protein [Sinorhizobium fredii]
MFDRSARNGRAKRHQSSIPDVPMPTRLHHSNFFGSGDNPAARPGCRDAVGRRLARGTSATFHSDRAEIHAPEMIRDIIVKISDQTVPGVCQQLHRRSSAKADPAIHPEIGAAPLKPGDTQPSLLTGGI